MVDSNSTPAEQHKEAGTLGENIKISEFYILNTYVAMQLVNFHINASTS